MKLMKQRVRLLVGRVATVNGNSVFQGRGLELETTQGEAARMAASGQCELVGKPFEVDAPEIKQSIVESVVETEPPLQRDDDDDNSGPQLDPDGPKETDSEPKQNDPLAKARAKKKKV